MTTNNQEIQRKLKTGFNKITQLKSCHLCLPWRCWSCVHRVHDFRCL